MALGASAAGVSLVAGDPQWTDREYEFILTHSKSRYILTDAEHAERALALSRTVPTLQEVLVVGEDLKGSISYGGLINDPPETFLDGLPDVPDTSEGSLNYTSGTTTGRPKAVEFKQVHVVTGLTTNRCGG